MHFPPGFALAVCAVLSTATIAVAQTPSFDVRDLDLAISPCTDFNGFVNAKWIAANPIPADRTSRDTFDVLNEQSLQMQHDIVERAAHDVGTATAGSVEQKIGLFYRAGMAEEAIEKAGFTPIKRKLATIDALKSAADIAGYVTDGFTQGQGTLFVMRRSPDFKNSKVQIAYAFQGGLGLPSPEYYSATDYAKIRDAYRTHIAKVLELVGVKPADAEKQAEQVLAFETRLARASLAPAEMRRLDNLYNFVSLADADKLTPHFSWTRFFSAQKIDIQGGFSLSQPKFFGEIDQMLADVPLEQWQAYLRFHVADAASPYLSRPFSEENFAFYGRMLNGQEQQKPRWKRVLGALNDGMGMALGELYVARMFPPESKVRALELVSNVTTALKARIEHLDWMSDETKKKALEKWSTLLPKIGYPDTWRDWSGLSISPDDYFANVEAARKYNYAYDMAKIGKPTDRLEWSMTPQTVNAYYAATDNTINFSAAILQPPLFDAKADDALNYGGFGAVIGHEATHGYDDQGNQFDAQGNQANWWTKEDREKFDSRTARLVAQFNGYSPLPGKHVNGELTLGENIADLGGASVAFDALQIALKKNPGENRRIEGYTPDQRFFLGFGRIWRGSMRPERLQVMLNTNPHSPSQYRAIGVLSNMPAFAEVFGCKAGDPMVHGSDKQVNIW